MLDTPPNPLLRAAPVVAAQQPPWDGDDRLPFVRRQLRARPSLVRTADVLTLRRQLAEVAAGRAHVVQAGDCAEDFADCTAPTVARKAGLLDSLAGMVRMNTGLPVVRVGRIAGQFAKPRSRPTEQVGDRALPVYRGHMVNDPAPEAAAREPNPWRLLTGYHAAREAMRHLGWREDGGDGGPEALGGPPVWSSHEALLLDYERSMLRLADDVDDADDGAEAGDGAGPGVVLGSTHWPWIGERTRQPDGAHVRLLAGVVNPVACKVGPTTTVADLLDLCVRLDPHRAPGRLTLIVRMGQELVAERLPALVRAVRRAGHPVIWLSDPMHGNTVPHADGRKTREVETVVGEVLAFEQAVRSAGGAAAGLHLETTPEDVSECVPGPAPAGDGAPDRRYTSLCDPRLNPGQATTVAAAFGCGARHG
ncbi:3-deoxy-7-phosphoheptulonate synthase [Streptomyces sp. NPDC003717]|uniref:3-deoxy-7-phosphoheptulonate synthase n=1 Tax=Streptomyces sp. NPDC003717 TaxID=3154276 RepID=UPI0033BDB98F